MDIQTYRERISRQVSDSTVSSRVSAVKSLNSFIGGKDPEPEDVAEWVDELSAQHSNGEIKASTIRQYIRSVDSYFEVIKGEYDALEHIKRTLPENDVDHGDYMTNEEWEDFLEAAVSLEDELIIKLMYYYARRPTEILLLNKEDVDLEEGTITFNILKKKDNNLPHLVTEDSRHRVMRATFEIMPEVESQLERYMKFSSNKKEHVSLEQNNEVVEELDVAPLFQGSQGRYCYETLRLRIKKVAKKAGIEKNITPKSERHSRATHLDWEGESPEEISRHQLLHGPNSDSIKNYIHEKEEGEVRKVMRPGSEKDEE